MLHKSETAERLRLVYCRTGEENYCLDMDRIQSILRYEHLERNREPEGPLGWLHQGGSRLPVFSMSERLGRPAAEEEGAIVVLRGATERWGLAVDRVSRPFDVTPDKVMAVPAPAQSGAFDGVVLTPEGLVLRVLPDRLHLAGQVRQPRWVGQAVSPAHSISTLGGNQQVSGKVLLFSAGRESMYAEVIFGFSFSQVLEVCSGLPRVNIPGAPKHVLGMVEWRERPVAAIDLGGLAGLPPVSYRSDSRMVIVHAGAGEQVLAVPVTAGMRWESLPLPHRPCGREVPLDCRYARGVFEKGDEILMIPDLDAIVESLRGAS